MKTLARTVTVVGMLLLVLDLADRYVHHHLRRIAGAHVP